MTLQQKLDIVASMLAQRSAERNDLHWLPDGSEYALCGFRVPKERRGTDTAGRDRCTTCLRILARYKAKRVE